MKKWIYCPSYKQSMPTCSKLEILGFTWGQGTFMLCDPRYIYVNLETKACHIGCRYPSQIKKEDILSRQEMFKLIKQELRRK